METEAASDVEELWEGEEEDMNEDDKDWLIQGLRERDIPRSQSCAICILNDVNHGQAVYMCRYTPACLECLIFPESPINF